MLIYGHILENGLPPEEGSKYKKAVASNEKKQQSQKDVVLCKLVSEEEFVKKYGTAIQIHPTSV